MADMPNDKPRIRGQDLTGRLFGRWTAIRYYGDFDAPPGVKRFQWLCICQCGQERTLYSGSLTSGRSKSCGCYKKETAALRFGMTPEQVAALNLAEQPAKKCTRCLLTKPRNDFGTNIESNGRLRATSRCKNCLSILRAARVRRQNPEHVRRTRRYISYFRKYGLSKTEVSDMESRQGFCCAICGDKKPLHMDHCHATDRVRSLLCRGCNIGLGNFKDSIVLLGKAAEYLSSHSV